MENWTKSEAAFAREKTRSLLVDWADQTFRLGFFVHKESEKVYVEVARERKWVSKKELKVISTGFTAAAGFLKR